MTVVCNLDTGDLLWVGDGKSADSFGVFLAALSQETAAGIQAVAMDMGPAYQAAVREQLPKATLVFDRFHVMKLYSDMIRKVRKTEFRKADADGKAVIKGSLYLLLGNRQRLDESDISLMLYRWRVRRSVLSIRIATNPANRITPSQTAGIGKCGSASLSIASQTRIAMAKVPSSTKSPTISRKILFSHFME